MKFCSKCGKEIFEEAVVCPNCGCAVEGAKAVNDAPNAGFAVLSFFIPIVGLILYLVYKDSAPLKAKSAGKWGLIGFVTGIALSVVYSVVLGAVLGSILSAF